MSQSGLQVSQNFPIDSQAIGSAWIDEFGNLKVDLSVPLDRVVPTEGRELQKRDVRKPSEKDLLRLAARIYDSRRARDQVFLQDRLFGEPAWDMLLALYTLPRRGEFLTVSSLTHASDTTSATGIRWQARLTDLGLIERGPLSPEDRRLAFVRLTHEGRRLIEDYLTKIIHREYPKHVEKALDNSSD